MGLLDWIYPKRCVGCGRTGRYVCGVCANTVQCKGHSLRYEGMVRKAIKEIKYRGSYDMIQELVYLWEQKVDMKVGNGVVTAVPMWAQKEKKRGFNQAVLVAREIAKRWELRYVELLVRTRDTKPMYGLDRTSRQKNVSNAFALIHKNQALSLKHERVILVDDVWTTGETMRECAKVLSKNGMNRVVFVTIAR